LSVPSSPHLNPIQKTLIRASPASKASKLKPHTSTVINEENDDMLSVNLSDEEDSMTNSPEELFEMLAGKHRF